MSIDQWITANESVIRLSFFFGVFGIMAVWEVLRPRRRLIVSKLTRWTNNLGLVFLNTIMLRLLFPAAAVGVAVFVDQEGWGLLNYYSVPFIVAVFIAVVAMDFIIYLQHVLVHAVPALWRLHRVHHADRDYDVTTGARFHPIEIILSMLIKFSTIVVLGAPVIAVIMFEIILNAMAMFNHANIKLPQQIDKFLRRFVVTPDMHRVHHSIEDDEANSNFGFNLSIWDRAFGTYREQARAGQEAMIFGIHKYTENKDVAWITGMLTLPFKGKISDYAINRRQWSKSNDKQE
ncbi:MAG: sterol desaturase family protein [Gammaproteobacteria bacterium]|nr:sterol desaturase family protein [Gammaproteobacteria bacterium]